MKAGSGGLERVRSKYGVPAYRGARIRFGGRPGFVVSARTGGLVLGVRFDDDNATIATVHPTYLIEYGDDPPKARTTNTQS